MPPHDYGNKIIILKLHLYNHLVRYADSNSSFLGFDKNALRIYTCSSRDVQPYTNSVY